MLFAIQFGYRSYTLHIVQYKIKAGMIFATITVHLQVYMQASGFMELPLYTLYMCICVWFHILAIVKDTKNPTCHNIV